MRFELPPRTGRWFRLLERLVFEWLLVSAPAKVIGARMTSDVIEPCLKAALVAIRAAVLQDPHENVLNEILSRGPIARDPTQEVKERLVIALEEDSETGHVAIPNLQHQRLVRHGACTGENLASGKWLRVSL